MIEWACHCGNGIVTVNVTD